VHLVRVRLYPHAVHLIPPPPPLLAHVVGNFFPDDERRGADGESITGGEIASAGSR
jgi:hypothetical protein